MLSDNVRIGVLEGEMDSVEDAISAAEQKIDEATRAKVEKDVDYWRSEEAQLRRKEAQLRDELKRKEEQQGGKLSFTCAPTFPKPSLLRAQAQNAF